MARFRFIPEFPDYQIGDDGTVYSFRRGLFMTHSPTAHGEMTVGLTAPDGKQHRRSVKVLVARSFVDGEDEVFDTPILRDGDRENLNADNIVWRPRWFALLYVKQFDEPKSWWYAGPVVDDTLGVVYENILHAAIETGTLLKDIRTALMNHNRVFPQGYTFRFG
jgi:hypothetical protein